MRRFGERLSPSAFPRTKRTSLAWLATANEQSTDSRCTSSLKSEALRLLDRELEPLLQLRLGGVRRQEKVVEARVRGREAIRVSAVLAYHQGLSKRQTREESNKRDTDEHEREGGQQKK